MQVNAYAAYQAKENLKEFNYDSKVPEGKEVEIKITHCGICHSDIHLIDNDWMISQYPLVPGHEIVGIVTKTGKDVTDLKPGMRVGVGWQSGACHECEWCTTSQENLCAKSVATCVGKFGGFADHIITDSRFAFPIPEALDSENAAPLLCGGITVYSPLKNYEVKPSHKVGVIGIGGLGHLALQFARAMGCEVTAFSTSADKEEEAKSFGAHKFVNSKDKKQMQEMTGKLDFILSTVTASLDWMDYMNVLRPNGKLIFVGAAPGNIEIPPMALVLGQKIVGGSVIGGIAILKEMLDFAARNGIKAKTELFKAADVNKAVEKVRSNTIRYRAVLEM